LRRPVARMREIRLDFLLKLYFAQQFGPVEAKALVKAQIAACRDYLERQKTSTRDLNPTSFESLVLESKLTAAESMLDWLNRIASRVVPRQRRSASRAKQTVRNRRPVKK